MQEIKESRVQKFTITGVKGLGMIEVYLDGDTLIVSHKKSVLLLQVSKLDGFSSDSSYLRLLVDAVKKALAAFSAAQKMEKKMNLQSKTRKSKA